MVRTIRAVEIRRVLRRFRPDAEQPVPTEARLLLPGAVLPAALREAPLSLQEEEPAVPTGLLSVLPPGMRLGEPVYRPAEALRYGIIPEAASVLLRGRVLHGLIRMQRIPGVPRGSIRLLLPVITMRRRREVPRAPKAGVIRLLPEVAAVVVTALLREAVAAAEVDARVADADVDTREGCLLEKYKMAEWIELGIS